METEHLTRQAIRLAQRENRKNGRILTKEDVLRQRVQTVSPWMRRFVVLIGVSGIGVGATIYFADAPWWAAMMFIALGLAAIVIGIVGKKKHLEAELRRLPTGVADGILSGILDSLI
jgi:hypothetical protein